MEKLSPRRLKWSMFDGTFHDVGIHKCRDCIKQQEELENFRMHGDNWINDALSKLFPKAQRTTAAKLVPIGVMIGGMICH